jgi:hypothetical protein
LRPVGSAGWSRSKNGYRFAGNALNYLGMKQRIIVIGLLLAAQTLCAKNDNTTVDLYAGWSWLPYRFYEDGPYRYGHFPYRWSWPLPLRTSKSPLGDSLYGYTGYSPAYWGFENGVRLRLRGAREFPAAIDPPPPLPGSAPLELRDPQREAAWMREIADFLGALQSPGSPSAAAATNAPPQP